MTPPPSHSLTPFPRESPSPGLTPLSQHPLATKPPALAPRTQVTLPTLGSEPHMRTR